MKHFSVAAALTFALLELANHEDVQRAAREEVLNVLNSECNEAITSLDIRKLKYLETVIKETLRLHSPVPFIARRLRRDLELDQGRTVVPAGIELWMNLHALHTNSRVWTDPFKFDPERFTLENSRERHPFAFVPFSAGLRNCIGQRYAMNMMKVTLASVLRRYKIVPVTKRDDVRPALELTLKTLDPIVVKFEKLVD